MADRLEVLRQQRALAQEQVAWFDREIAALQTSAPEVRPAGPAAEAPLAAPRPPLAVVATARPAATSPLPEFPEYQADPAGMQSAARRGCLMYAALAFLFLILGCVAIYFLGYRDHPVLFAEKPAAPAAK